MALRLKAVGLAVALTLTVPVVAATPAAAVTTPTTAPTAAGWLTEQFTAGTHLQTPFAGTYYDDYGLTADAVLALDAAKVGQNYAVAATTWLTQHVADYAGGGTTESYAGPLAKLALVAQAQGLDPTNFGGRNLLTALEARQNSTTGRFSDKSAYGDYSNAITQSLAVIAERRAGRSSAIVGQGLTSLYSLQCTDHGFALNYQHVDPADPANNIPAPCTTSNLTDNDATSYAVQAGINQTRGGLIPTQISQALDYLLTAQAPATGGLPESSSAGDDNTNSTGLAAIAFAIGGRTGTVSNGHNTGATGAGAFVAALQQPSGAADTRVGAVAFDFPGFSLDSALRATPQAIFGLAEWDGAGVDKNASYELISKAGAATAAPVPAKASGSFVAITPARLLDTRQSAAVPAGATLTVGVAGHAGVPADASAATVNITAVTPTGTGNVAVYPTGGARPTTSVLNLITGQTVAGSTLVALGGATGAISVINNSNHPLQLIVDVTGYTRAGAGRAAGAYRSVDPTRLLDTRKTTPVPALGSVDVAVHGSSVDASSDAAAAAITVTAVSAAGPGNLVAYPSGGARPTASTVNLITGQTVANSAVVPVGANGKITVHNDSNKAVNVLVDITGYFVNGTPALSGTFVPVTPARLLDTRTSGAIAALGTRPVTVAGIPAGGASIVFGNVTGVVPTGPGYLVTYAASGSRPGVSSVNLFPGQTVANLSVTTIGSNGQIVIGDQSQQAVNALFDVAGYVRS